LEFKQIGTDGGLLAAPVTVKRLLLGPAERADVLIDFTGLEGQTFLLHNSAKVPFHNVDQDDDETPLPELMIVRVKACRSGDCGGGARVPTALRPFKPIPEASATKSRDLTLNEAEDRYGRKLPLLNNTMWTDPVTELPRLNSTEVWSFINLTDDTHAMHLHLVQYQILDRRPFNKEKYDETGKLVFTGPARPPAPNEIGWKDTVQAFPGFVTRVIARFDRLGDYVWHCHILEHEDYEMMRPFRVVE
jgi:spore coat protein A